jgi:hypothetical protein
VYGRQTEDYGHGEQMLSLSAVVTRPFNKPFPYLQQQTYVAIKDFGYFNYKDISDTENTTLFLTTFRVVPQERWGLNRAFGTPIEMVDRVIQKEWRATFTPPVLPGNPGIDFTVLDAFGRIKSIRYVTNQQLIHIQASNIYEIITSPSSADVDATVTDFRVEGDTIYTNGIISFDIQYLDDSAPGVIFNV